MLTYGECALTHYPETPTLPTKESILEAAKTVIRTQGLSKATTREIAKQAGCAEGSIYKHFRDKSDLFVTALQDSAPPFLLLMKSLESRAGERTVRANLEEVAREAANFFGDVMPISATLFSQPELLADHRRALKEKGAGPQRAYAAVAAYVRAEQKLGRINPKAKPLGAAALLLGACYQHAFLRHLLDEDMVPISDDKFPSEIVRSLLEGLAVHEEHKEK